MSRSLSGHGEVIVAPIVGKYGSSGTLAAATVSRPQAAALRLWFGESRLIERVGFLKRLEAPPSSRRALVEAEEGRDKLSGGEAWGRHRRGVGRRRAHTPGGSVATDGEEPFRQKSPSALQPAPMWWGLPSSGEHSCTRAGAGRGDHGGSASHANQGSDRSRGGEGGRGSAGACGVGRAAGHAAVETSRAHSRTVGGSPRRRHLSRLHRAAVGHSRARLGGCLRWWRST